MSQEQEQNGITFMTTALSDFINIMGQNNMALNPRRSLTAVTKELDGLTRE